MEDSAKIGDSVRQIDPHIEKLVSQEQTVWDAVCSVNKELRNYDIATHTYLWVCSLSKLFQICGGSDAKTEDQILWLTGEFLDKANYAAVYSRDDEQHTLIITRFNFVLKSYAHLCFEGKNEIAIDRMFQVIKNADQGKINFMLVVAVNALFELAKYHQIIELAQEIKLSEIVLIEPDGLTHDNILEFYYQLGISFFTQFLHTQANEYFSYASCLTKRDTSFDYEKRLLLSASINAFLSQTDQFYMGDEIFAQHFDTFLRKVPIRHVFCEIINAMKNVDVSRVVSLILQEDFSQVVPQVNWTCILKRVVKSMRTYKLHKVLSDYDAMPIKLLVEYDDITLHEARRLDIEDTLQFVTSNINSFPDFTLEHLPEAVLRRRQNASLKEDPLDLESLTQKNFALFETIDSLETMADRIKGSFYKIVSAE